MDDDHSAWSPAPFQRQPGEQWIVVAPSFDTARATVLWTILGLTLVLVLVFYGRLLIAIPGIILNNYTIGAIGEAMAALRVTSAPVLRLTLLVALLTASWQWVAARPASAGSGRRVGLVGLAALLAVVLFWLPSFLPHLSSLGLPEAVSSFLPVALSAGAFRFGGIE